MPANVTYRSQLNPIEIVVLASSFALVALFFLLGTSCPSQWRKNKSPALMAGHFLYRLVAPTWCCPMETLARKRATQLVDILVFPWPYAYAQTVGAFWGRSRWTKPRPFLFQLGALRDPVRIAVQTIHLSSF